MPGWCGRYQWRLYAFALAFLFPCPAHSQEFVYVNTDNLIMRDRPEKKYMVFAILHAPSKLKVERYEDGYKNNKAVRDKFYQVSIAYMDDRKIHHFIGGWVEKKYVVTDKDKVMVAGADMGLELNESEVPLIPSMSDHNPNENNQAQFLAPKYKGGENPPPPVKRIYHKGPKGGCYYINGKRRKVYVEKHFCTGK